MSIRLPPALRHRRFTLLWLGLMISITGSQMQVWALYWHIRTLTDQPIAVGGVGAARFLPVLIFALVGGLVADRHDRRRIIFLTQTALALGLLTLNGEIQLWHIYLLTALQATAISFDLPARQSLAPNLAPPADLANAFSLQSIAQGVGAIIGPALSGIVIAVYGQAYTYLINALSFMAVILVLILMGSVSPRASTVHAAAWAAIKDGVQFILTQPIILSSMILDFFGTFFSSANTLLPFLARDVLHVGAIQYGWLSASPSIGSLLAAIFLSQQVKIRRQGPVMLWAVSVFGLATVLFGLSRNLFLTMFALALIGGSDSISTIIRNTVRQLVTPDEMRGRMTSINQIFFSGGPQLGEIESGIAAQAFGAPAAIVIGGVGCLAAAGWIAWRWPPLRRYEG